MSTSRSQGQKKDLRVSKTQRALVGALFALLEKQSFQKITVNDLCAAAMVGRATFYLHFEDKYHLLRFSLQEMREQLQCGECGENREELIRNTVEQISKKKRLFRNLFLEDGSQELIKMLTGMFIQEFNDEMQRRVERGDIPFVPPSTLAVFLAGGVTSLLVWWISGDYPIPKEEVVQILLVLSQMDGKAMARQSLLLPEHTGQSTDAPWSGFPAVLPKEK